MNKTGGFTDLFLFIIVGFVLVLVSGIMIYLSFTVNEKLDENLGQMDFGDKTGEEIIEESMGKVDTSFQALYWIASFIIVGMILSIFMGSYLVTTRPIFFVPYIFVIVIAIIVSTAVSNAYHVLIATPEVASIYAGFTGANFIMLNLPIWVTIIGFVGGLIMFLRMGSKEQEIYGGGYGY